MDGVVDCQVGDPEPAEKNLQRGISIYPITVSLVKWLHHFSVRIERNWPKTDGI